MLKLGPTDKSNNYSDTSLKKRNLRKSSILYHDSGIDADESMFNSKEANKVKQQNKCSNNGSYSGDSGTNTTNNTNQYDVESLKSNLALNIQNGNASKMTEISLKTVSSSAHQSYPKFNSHTVDKNAKFSNTGSMAKQTSSLKKNDHLNSFENLLLFNEFVDITSEALIGKKASEQTHSTTKENLKNVSTNSKADFTPQLEKELFTKSSSLVRKVGLCFFFFYLVSSNLNNEFLVKLSFNLIFISFDIQFFF